MSAAAVAAANASSTTTVGSAATPQQQQQQLQTTTTNSNMIKSMILCRYFLRGICRYGSICRFSHDLSLAVESGELAAAISLTGGACNAEDVAANNHK